MANILGSTQITGNRFILGKFCMFQSTISFPLLSGLEKQHIMVRMCGVAEGLGSCLGRNRVKKRLSSLNTFQEHTQNSMKTFY